VQCEEPSRDCRSRRAEAAPARVAVVLVTLVADSARPRRTRGCNALHSRQLAQSATVAHALIVQAWQRPWSLFPFVGAAPGRT